MNTHEKLIRLIEAMQLYFIQRSNEGDDLAGRLAIELEEMLQGD